jgi:hypothetical protein
MSTRALRRIPLLTAVSTALLVLVLPAPAHAGGGISSLGLNPDTVRGGASSTGTVTLSFADGLPTTVLLFSSDPSVASVPSSLVMPGGATSGSFPITTNASAPATNVAITAALDGFGRTQTLSVNAATPAGASLSSVSVTPTSVTGGSGSTGTVRFTAVTDGAGVQLSSSNPAVARVPADMVVNGGASSGTFAVATSAVSTTTNVTITASWFAVTRTTTITVTPGAPAANDRVTIKKATWRAGLLTIEATSTNPNAILSVYGTGGFMFTLTNNGGGRYSDKRGFIFNPMQITVRSNFGGSASASL